MLMSDRLMRSQCIRTALHGKGDMSLSQSLTCTIRRPSTRLRLPSWLARSYTRVLQLGQVKPPSVDNYTEHKQRALARSEVFTQSSLEKELQYLKDPRKLADHIHNLLGKDQYLKAYELVKMSSKDLPCTVSWNHLIDYEMSQGRAGNASKIYNDVWER